MLNKKESNGNVYSHNLVASGTKITGNLEADTDIRIDGEIQGDLSCSNKVIVGSSGLIVGNISCVSVDIMGSIEGTVSATESVSMKTTSNIRGDIRTKVIAIEPGAHFVGNCKTNFQE
jgi:cytoskeletal protein CcmA (bactofilin family)